MDINEKLPENYEWYRDQIAGHHPSVIRNGVRQIGIIKEKGSDLILKLVQEGDRGKREVDLYERVERCTSENSVLFELRNFLPRYYGCRSIKLGTKENEFLELEDVTNPYKMPCIMDIKIGQVTYDPLASDEKKIAESSKAPFQKKLGFRVLGYRVHSDGNKGINSRDRLWGRELSEDNIQQAFEEFLVQVRPEEALEILDTYIVQLDRISKWFDSQEQLHFYASSLLFVYEGHLKDKTNSSTKMIDFSHVFDQRSGKANGKDLNYIYGLNYIQKIFHLIRTNLLSRQ